METPVRIGIVGAGFAAQFHLASYRKVYGESFQIAGIAARSVSSVQALADRYGIEQRFESVDAMLRDPAINVIDLCVPNHWHVPLILEAARCGKHVICEKPLGGYFGPAAAAEQWSADGASRRAMLDSVVEQVRTVEDAIKRAGVTLCYGENWVYAPPIVKVDRLMAASASTILRIEAEESHSGSHSPYARRWRTAGGGSLLRLGAHPIGAALHLKYQEGRRRAGTPIRPIGVLAQVANLTSIESFRSEPRHHVTVGWEDVEDWATLILTFEDGSVAELTATDTRLGGIRNYLTAHGSRAVATGHINPNNACQAFTPDEAYFESEYLVEKTQTKQGWSFPAPDEDAITGYPEELRDFVGAIATGRMPKSDLLLAGDVMRVIYAGYLSAQQGAAVDLRAWY